MLRCRDSPAGPEMLVSAIANRPSPGHHARTAD
jgi:hypothetical protein